MRELLPARNLLAHSPVETNITIVSHLDKDDVVEAQETTFEHYVVTSRDEALRTAKRVSMGMDDLPKHFDAVHAAWERILAFRMRLQGPPSESAQRKPQQSPD